MPSIAVSNCTADRIGVANTAPIASVSKASDRYWLRLSKFPCCAARAAASFFCAASVRANCCSSLRCSSAKFLVSVPDLRISSRIPRMVSRFRRNCCSARLAACSACCNARAFSRAAASACFMSCAKPLACSLARCHELRACSAACCACRNAAACCCVGWPEALISARSCSSAILAAR